MTWVAALLAQDEKGADSVVVGGLLIILCLIFLQAYDVIWLSHSFGAINFATASGGTLGALGGAKRFRDGKANGNP